MYVYTTQEKALKWRRKIRVFSSLSLPFFFLSPEKRFGKNVLENTRGDSLSLFMCTFFILIRGVIFFIFLKSLFFSLQGPIHHFLEYEY